MALTLRRVNTFTLQTNDGQTLDFVVGTLDVSDGGLPAPHLREHMAGSTPHDRVLPHRERPERRRQIHRRRRVKAWQPASQ